MGLQIRQYTLLIWPTITLKPSGVQPPVLENWVKTTDASGCGAKAMSTPTIGIQPRPKRTAMNFCICGSCPANMTLIMPTMTVTPITKSFTCQPAGVKLGLYATITPWIRVRQQRSLPRRLCARTRSTSTLRYVRPDYERPTRHVPAM